MGNDEIASKILEEIDRRTNGITATDYLEVLEILHGEIEARIESVEMEIEDV